jgi:hypothetical protein
VRSKIPIPCLAITRAVLPEDEMDDIVRMSLVKVTSQIVGDHVVWRRHDRCQIPNPLHIVATPLKRKDASHS